MYKSVSSLFDRQKSISEDTDIGSICSKFENTVDEFIAKYPFIHGTHGDKDKRRRIKPIINIISNCGAVDAFDIGAYRFVGGLTISHKIFGFDDRIDWVGHRLCDLLTNISDSNHFKAVCDTLPEVSSRQGISTWNSIKDESKVRIGTALPFDVDGKMCMVTCVILLHERPELTPDSELTCAVRMMDAFRNEIFPSVSLFQFAKANLREYITVDYPRKFLWHSSMFRVKNTFLEFKTHGIEEDEMHVIGPSVWNNETRALCARIKTAWTSSLPAPIMLDIKRICGTTIKKKPKKDVLPGLLWETTTKKKKEEEEEDDDDEDASSLPKHKQKLPSTAPPSSSSSSSSSSLFKYEEPDSESVLYSGLSLERFQAKCGPPCVPPSYARPQPIAPNAQDYHSSTNVDERHHPPHDAPRTTGGEVCDHRAWAASSTHHHSSSNESARESGGRHHPPNESAREEKPSRRPGIPMMSHIASRKGAFDDGLPSNKSLPNPCRASAENARIVPFQKEHAESGTTENGKEMMSRYWHASSTRVVGLRGLKEEDGKENGLGLGGGKERTNVNKDRSFLPLEFSPHNVSRPSWDYADQHAVPPRKCTTTPFEGAPSDEKREDVKSPWLPPSDMSVVDKSRAYSWSPRDNAMEGHEYWSTIASSSATLPTMATYFPQATQLPPPSTYRHDYQPRHEMAAPQAPKDTSMSMESGISSRTSSFSGLTPQKVYLRSASPLRQRLRGVEGNAGGNPPMSLSQPQASLSSVLVEENECDNNNNNNNTSWRHWDTGASSSASHTIIPPIEFRNTASGFQYHWRDSEKSLEAVSTTLPPSYMLGVPLQEDWLASTSPPNTQHRSGYVSRYQCGGMNHSRLCDDTHQRREGHQGTIRASSNMEFDARTPWGSEHRQGSHQPLSVCGAGKGPPRHAENEATRPTVGGEKVAFSTHYENDISYIRGSVRDHRTTTTTTTYRSPPTIAPPPSKAGASRPKPLDSQGKAKGECPSCHEDKGRGGIVYQEKWTRLSHTLEEDAGESSNLGTRPHQYVHSQATKEAIQVQVMKQLRCDSALSEQQESVDSGEKPGNNEQAPPRSRARQRARRAARRREAMVPQMNDEQTADDSPPTTSTTKITEIPGAKKSTKETHFRPSDRVEVHSFEKTNWLNGCTATVKRVFVERRSEGRNRARIQILYDDATRAYYENFPSTVPQRNLRLI